MDLIQSTKEDIGRIAAQLASMGWAEANAGNISVLLPAGSDSSIWDEDVITDILPSPIPELAGRTFLVTCAGSRFRKLPMELDTEIIPVRVSADGMKVIRLASGKEPTTEFRPPK